MKERLCPLCREPIEHFSYDKYDMISLSPAPAGLLAVTWNDANEPETAPVVMLAIANVTTTTRTAHRLYGFGQGCQFIHEKASTRQMVVGLDICEGDFLIANDWWSYGGICFQGQDPRLVVGNLPGDHVAHKLAEKIRNEATPPRPE